MPAIVIKELSQPANDNNKQLTMHETRNQNFLLVCMLKLGEMPVNELFFKKKKKETEATNCKMAFRVFIKI